jgi:hypothetical protein
VKAEHKRFHKGLGCGDGGATAWRKDGNPLGKKECCGRMVVLPAAIVAATTSLVHWRVGELCKAPK